MERNLLLNLNGKKSDKNMNIQYYEYNLNETFLKIRMYTKRKNGTVAFRKCK
jgi:hypothetical protein